MTHQFVPFNLLKMINQKHLRKMLAGKVDNYLYMNMVENDTEDLKGVNLKRYQFLSAMLYCVIQAVDKGYVSPRIVRKIVDSLVVNNLIREDQNYYQIVEEFEEKYGEKPPTFIVLSPTQRCNLKCVGCYASSAADTLATILYSVVDRITKEAHDIFGSRFITISGGEPFTYRSEDRTLFEIFEKYNDTFYLVYTNGTLIDEKLAKKLAEVANVTPAISVEGFEKETDRRRGAGTYKKILKAFENLRKAGVPFGISVTSTSENVDILLTDDFYDFYFQQQGACYMWQFQLMPIGRATDEAKLMVQPRERLRLYRKWEQLLRDKKYCVADFWNSGVLARGCIAYGRSGGYIYIDWNGNITPCVFIPYYVDNIYEVYKQGKTLADAVFSDFMKNGRKWQQEYGLDNWKKPKNWLSPCSIRDHYEIFRNSIISQKTKPADEKAREAIHSEKYFEFLKNYDDEWEKLTCKIWESEYLSPCSQLSRTEAS